MLTPFRSPTIDIDDFYRAAASEDRRSPQARHERIALGIAHVLDDQG
ncbi:hypothetical protein ABTZ58_20315 [Streptomyces sp. NPDC094143]